MTIASHTSAVVVAPPRTLQPITTSGNALPRKKVSLTNRRKERVNGELRRKGLSAYPQRQSVLRLYEDVETGEESGSACNSWAEFARESVASYAGKRMSTHECTNADVTVGASEVLSWFIGATSPEQPEASGGALSNDEERRCEAELTTRNGRAGYSGESRCLASLQLCTSRASASACVLRFGLQACRPDSTSPAATGPCQEANRRNWW